MSIKRGWDALLRGGDFENFGATYLPLAASDPLGKRGLRRNHFPTGVLGESAWTIVAKHRQILSIGAALPGR